MITENTFNKIFRIAFLFQNSHRNTLTGPRCTAILSRNDNKYSKTTLLQILTHGI